MQVQSNTTLPVSSGRERVHGHPPAGEALDAYGPYDAELMEKLMPALGVFLAAWAIAIARRHPSPVAKAYVHERDKRPRNEMLLDELNEADSDAIDNVERKLDAYRAAVAAQEGR